MDLERVAAVIRPRTPWEAVDLGFGMARAWWKPLWAAWFATVAPLWWLIWLLLAPTPFLAFGVLWWLRPLFDRVPLYVVSRCLFGSTPSAGEVLRALPRLLGRNFLAGITVQRLDPARSFDLPVWELEGLRGAERRNRTAILQRVGHSNAVWLTLACSLLEGCAILAVTELATLLSPSSGWFETLEIASSDETTTAFWWWMAVTAFSGLTLIEPFYVAGGFSLYLSRRIHLEGWDVEIALRRLAARLTGDSAGKPGRAAMILIATLLLGGGGLHAQTLQTPPPAPPKSPTSPAASPAPAEAIREILAQPDFQTTKKVKVWRFKGEKPEKPEEKPEEEPPERAGLPLGFLRPVALLVALVLVCGLVAVAVQGFRGRRPALDDAKPDPLPATVFGLDIRPESMPENVPGAAWSAWERGEPDAALGLLYRAAIAFLVRREGLPVRESWTEGDCVDFVRRKTTRERADFFARLTRAWQTTAYAHRPPAAEEVRALCDGWNRHFAAREAA
jgi:hypothetical protein